MNKRKHFDRGVRIYKLLGHDFKKSVEYSLKNNHKLMIENNLETKNKLIINLDNVFFKKGTNF